ncbi:MAG: 2-hydroxyacid dehydrogenase [Hyphomicrobiaceae bacterium]
MTSYDVSCLDVFAPSVRAVIQQALPDNFSIRFAETYDPAEQLALVKQADLLLVGGAHLTGDMIRQAGRLRFIQKWGIGIDKIDLAAAEASGVGLAITAGANAGPVAELAIGLMIAVYRRIPYVDRNLRDGKWLKSEMRSSCYQITGKTVGLLGFGAIARMTARRLLGFDARVIYFDIRRAEAAVEDALNATYAPFDELLAQSDILSVHTPLTEQTRHLIGRDAIGRMKDGAVIINTARGGIVDEQALHDALVSGKLRGAGLDSFESEPLSPESRLLALDQVVLTPHAGGGVFDNVAPVAKHAIGNMVKFLSGEALRPQDVILRGRPASGGGIGDRS